MRHSTPASRAARRQARLAGLSALVGLAAWLGGLALAGLPGPAASVASSIGALLLAGAGFAGAHLALRAGACLRLGARRLARARPLARNWPLRSLALHGTATDPAAACLAPGRIGHARPWPEVVGAFGVGGLTALAVRLASSAGLEGAAIPAWSWVLPPVHLAAAWLLSAVRDGRLAALPPARIGARSLLLIRTGRCRTRPERWSLRSLAGLRTRWSEGRPVAALLDGRELELPTDPAGEAPIGELRARWEAFGRDCFERFGPPDPVGPPSASGPPPGARSEVEPLRRAQRWGALSLAAGLATAVVLAGWWTLGDPARGPGPLLAGAAQPELDFGAG